MCASPEKELTDWGFLKMNALLWLTSCESSRAPSLTELQSLHTTLCKDNVSGAVVLWLPLWIYLCVILCLYFCNVVILCSLYLHAASDVSFVEDFLCVNTKLMYVCALPVLLESVFCSFSNQTVWDWQDKHFVFWTWPRGQLGAAWLPLWGCVLWRIHLDESSYCVSQLLCYLTFCQAASLFPLRPAPFV